MNDETLLNVEGMTCSNCASGISRFLEKKGLENVRVDFVTGEVSFRKTAPETIDEIKSGINRLGYKVVDEKTGDSSSSKFDPLEIKFLVSSIFTLPLVLHMFIDYGLFHNPVFQLIMCIPVFIIGVLHFGRSALGSLRSGVPNMDVLVITGASAAFFYSVAGLLLYGNSHEAGNYLFFETAATIITIVLLGNIIEKRSVKQTTTALRDLTAIQPTFANKITVDKNIQEQIEITEAGKLKKGDVVLINTGAIVPVDGKIYWGSANIDESALTGESMPVEKFPKDMVMAGSIILSGSIKVLTEKAGSQTVLSDILELVKNAINSKPRVQKLGDKLSAWFVPVVVGISILTFIISYFVFDKPAVRSVMASIAVLVISCPCAMGLATPTAVAVGLGKALKNGIIIKGGATLEQFSGLKTVVFDKTGTLTSGKFRIAGFNTHGISKNEANDIIVSLEQHSQHPIAESLLNSLKNNTEKIVPFKEINETRGAGLHAIDESGNTYILGSFKSNSHLTTDENHSVYLSRNNQLIATLDLEDEVRTGAEELISELNSQGIDTVMVSGDHHKACMEVAVKTGIKTVYSKQLPHQKTEIIRQLKQKGTLMMVGDGINDAPSLAMADIGLSFGEATRIAVNSAQVILLKNNDLMMVMKPIYIGRQTLRTIKQNLFWAFFYNVIAIPIAAIGMLSPIIAAFSMAFSDVIVIGNSIRLKFLKI